MKPDLQLDDDRTALTKDALKSAFLDNLFYMQGKFPALATDERLLHGAGVRGARPHAAALDQHRGRLYQQASRTVAYLSAEFLMGPHLGNNSINLGILDRVGSAWPNWA